MKRNYGYFIIKPDGARNIKEITQEIEANFESVKYYAIDNFDVIIKKLYHRHYKKKGDKFGKTFESYLYGLREIFGNKAILVLLANKKLEYKHFAQKMFEMKTQIREKYTNDNVGIATNYGDEKYNCLRYITNEGNIKTPRILKEYGNNRISNMNVIHAPDPEIPIVLEELKILLDEKVIDNSNLIPRDIMEKIKEYKCFNITTDMRKANFVGEIIPEISGLIKEKIEQERDEYLYEI